MLPSPYVTELISLQNDAIVPLQLAVEIDPCLVYGSCIESVGLLLITFLQLRVKNIAHISSLPGAN